MCKLIVSSYKHPFNINKWLQVGILIFKSEIYQMYCIVPTNRKSEATIHDCCFPVLSHTHTHTHPHSHMYNRIFCLVLLHLAYTTVNTQQVYIVVVKYADDTSSGHFVTILL